MHSPRLGLGLSAASGGRVSPLSVFGAALIYDFYFGDPANVTLDVSDNIASVVDSSGNGHAAIQATAANRPGYVIIGGKGHMVGGSNLRLATSSLTIAQPVEVFAFVRSTHAAPASNGYIVDNGLIDNILFQQAGASVFQIYSGTLGPTVAIPINTDIMLDALFSGASSQISLNNGTPSVGDAGSNAGTNPVTIGNVNASQGDQPFLDPIYRVFAINRAATSSEQAAVHTLARSYGVS